MQNQTNKNIKVVFFGTSDKSTPILEALHKNFDLILVVTKCDQKVGRKQETKQTAVKKWALQNNVKLEELKNTKPENLAGLYAALTELTPNVGVMADFSFIIPPKLISALDNRLINIHFSLLPKYRGASPIQHAILNGEKHTGISFMLTAPKMDTGDIIFQHKYPLDGNETTHELQHKLFETSAQLLPKVINDYLTGHLITKEQDHSKATYCYSKTKPESTLIFKEDAHINWADDLEYIERQVRAFSHWPVTWTTLNEVNNAKLHVTTNEEITKTVGDNTKQLRVKKDDKILKIYSALYNNGNLRINKVKVEGKNETSWHDFLNGYQIKEF